MWAWHYLHQYLPKSSFLNSETSSMQMIIIVSLTGSLLPPFNSVVSAKMKSVDRLDRIL